MEDILVNCNHCGNVLESKSHKRIETCPYCHTLLEIIRMSGSVYTKIYTENSTLETLEIPIEEAIAQENNERLELILFNQGIHKQISILDNQWQQALQQNPKNGLFPAINDRDNIGLNLLIGVIGVIITLLATSINSGVILSLGIIMLFYGTIQYGAANGRKRNFIEEKRLYEQKRNVLNKKLKIIPKSS